MTPEYPIGSEAACILKERLLVLLDKVVVGLMLAILLVLSLPVLQAYHAPKFAHTPPPPVRTVPPTHSASDNRLIFS